MINYIQRNLLLSKIYLIIDLARN